MQSVAGVIQNLTLECCIMHYVRQNAPVAYLLDIAVDIELETKAAAKRFTPINLQT
jgi:hypothetical protein